MRLYLKEVDDVANLDHVREIPLVDGVTTIGRAKKVPDDVSALHVSTYKNQSISSVHCWILVSNGTASVGDGRPYGRASVNGLWLNGDRVSTDGIDATPDMEFCIFPKEPTEAIAYTFRITNESDTYSDTETVGINLDDTEVLSVDGLDHKLLNSVDDLRDELNAIRSEVTDLIDSHQEEEMQSDQLMQDAINQCIETDKLQAAALSQLSSANLSMQHQINRYKYLFKVLAASIVFAGVLTAIPKQKMDTDGFNAAMAKLHQVAETLSFLVPSGVVVWGILRGGDEGDAAVKKGERLQQVAEAFHRSKLSRDALLAVPYSSHRVTRDSDETQSSYRPIKPMRANLMNQPRIDAELGGEGIERKQR